MSWTEDTGYVTGPDGKKRERGNGWSLGDANRVTAGQLRAMSPEERRAFWQQAAPGLPMPGSFESAELADQFSDQFNQGMADILRTLSLAAGTELATLPPLTKVPQVAAKAERSLDELSKAAGAVDRGELTMAGRALEKHGSRPGSAFPKATGSVADKNRLGQEVVDDILTSPGATSVTRHHARYGDLIEIRAPDGRGVRFDSNGNFIGFLEP